MTEGHLRIGIVCSNHTVYLTLKKFEVCHHGRLNFVWFPPPLVIDSCWGCTGWSIGSSIPCISPAHFIFWNLGFPLLVRTTRIIFHVNSIIWIILLVMRTPPIYILSFSFTIIHFTGPGYTGVSLLSLLPYDQVVDEFLLDFHRLHENFHPLNYSLW